MPAFFKHPLRVTARLLWFFGELVLITLDYVRRCGFRLDSAPLNGRITWLQNSSRRVLRILKVQIRVTGPVPVNGLLISNHLSYLDILVISSITPAVFVSKSEVRHWPIFGWFATMAGTLFVDRQRRTHVREMTNEMQSVLNQNVLLVLFPEGTSSNGQTVLPFKSSLLEPATNQNHPLHVGLIQYELEEGDGDVGEEVCYWKDMTLVPHLLNLFSKRSVSVTVRFSQITDRGSDRKELARHLHTEALKLKHSPPTTLITASR